VAPQGANMHEGWHHNNYFVLFSDPVAASERYAIARWLPGFTVVALQSWDHFVVRDAEGATFSVPTVPIAKEFLSPTSIPTGDAALRHDARFTGKIKWYLKPIVFGGAPDLSENLIWITHDEHAKLVVSWNEKYRALKAQASHA
jgi:hypothetical protein